MTEASKLEIQWDMGDYDLGPLDLAWSELHQRQGFGTELQINHSTHPDSTPLNPVQQDSTQPSPTQLNTTQTSSTRPNTTQLYPTQLNSTQLDSTQLPSTQQKVEGSDMTQHMIAQAQFGHEQDCQGQAKYSTCQGGFHEHLQKLSISPLDLSESDYGHSHDNHTGDIPRPAGMGISSPGSADQVNKTVNSTPTRPHSSD